ncbi:hypothetical protein CPB84DRAFT_1744195 [Gymnopilus junonius]|uniref:Uncharacterized protein n=1 Tax=Gymnopilus junonius TaxID=109634 RepID=A0A9P5NTZ1_GYMJU|nr:hypothetical protein CPB84DRAFT_1744195 [Gymnopilus junonius]
MLRTAPIRFINAPVGRRSVAYDHRAISDGHKATEHRRKPARGGQNLSDRYIRLEKSVRQKEVFSNKLEQIQPSLAQVVSQSSAGGLKPHQKPLQFFHGFQIPEEPKPPADDGYEKAVANLRSSLYGLGIPEYEWPASIQLKASSPNQSGPSDLEKRKDTILSAFEEMERSLALKRQAEVKAESRDGSPS